MMLDEAFEVRDNSRLSCQVKFTAALDGLRGDAGARVLSQRPPRRSGAGLLRPPPVSRWHLAALAACAPRSRSVGELERLEATQSRPQVRPALARSLPRGAVPRSSSALPALLAWPIGAPRPPRPARQRPGGAHARAASRRSAAVQLAAAGRPSSASSACKASRCSSSACFSQPGQQFGRRAAAHWSRSRLVRQRRGQRRERRRPRCCARAGPARRIRSSAGLDGDRPVELGVGAAAIGAEPDQLGHVGMQPHQPARLAHQLALVRRVAARRRARQAAQRVDRGEAAALGDRPVEHDVPVQDAAHRVADRLVGVVALDQHA